MQAVTIRLDDHNEELAVYGSRDQFLRQIRDTLGVRVLARNGQLRLEGDSDRVDRASKVVEGLRGRYRRQGLVTPRDVHEALEAVSQIEAEGLGRPNEGLKSGDRTVRPRTEGQAVYLDALNSSPLVFCVGPAGTGKTYLAVAAAVANLRRGETRKIVLVRPAVEAGERLGFLPGDLEAKINPYLRPLLDALRDLMPYEQLRRYMGNDLIEIAPLAYMRGRTLNDATIIMDEGQNATISQMKMFLTRMGANARIVVTGDTTQVDLDPTVINGLSDAVQRLEGIEGVAVVRLKKEDIVRHPLVQAIVDAYEDPESSLPTESSADAGPVLDRDHDDQEKETSAKGISTDPASGGA